MNTPFKFLFGRRQLRACTSQVGYFKFNKVKSVAEKVGTVCRARYPADRGIVLRSASEFVDGVGRNLEAVILAEPPDVRVNYIVRGNYFCHGVDFLLV